MSPENYPYYSDDRTVPETPDPGAAPKPWGKTTMVGRRQPRVDGYEIASGRAVYPSDVSLPGMLFGAVLRSPHPNAVVKGIDARAAEGMPGVLAVLTGASPGANLPWSYGNEVKGKLFESHCRYEGEAIAAVAAETAYQAADALAAIKVDFDVQPPLVDELKALQSGAPQVHDGGNRVKPTDRYQRGKVEEGFARADVVLEQSYRTECEIHTPLERHGCVARWERDRLTLWQSTQGVYRVQSLAAAALGMPLSKVRVIGRFMGGGFGSKLSLDKETIIAALLAKKTDRPVRLFLSREETFTAAGNRPPANMRLKAGIKKDGTLTALDFACTATGGAYPAGGAGGVDFLIKELYQCPNVRTELNDLFINACPSRPFRAPGHPQGAWALEQMMDALAEKIGMDPVALRLKNVPKASQFRPGNPPYTTEGLRQCLAEGAKAFGWEEARAAAGRAGKGNWKRGVGMAAGMWQGGAGGPPSTIIVKLFADGSVNLNMGASDIGAGTRTVMALIVSEELGVRPEVIDIENADTATTQYATPSGGSKTVPTESPAVRAAAIHVKQQLLAMAAEELKETPAVLSIRGGTIVSQSDPGKKLRIADVAGLKRQGLIVGVGYRGLNPPNRAINPFSVQFCEVEANVKTGEVRILRFLSAHDSGRAMSRLTFDSQVIGGVTMGIGLAMTEMRILDRNQTGKIVTGNWHDYKIPTAMDVPAEIVSLPLDLPDNAANSTGAKGLGEPVTIPTAAAVANAVFNATGLRITATPMSPVVLRRALIAAGQAAPGKR
ncbi:MAG: xanthine dehydrogenase family protein molybdopterin-binding subunit [Deltaproteobacteria bacterium]|nr:xanthine dehydrogenase family protein molybdopterin-binding subunit [Deltaproteobacteria bacterium]